VSPHRGASSYKDLSLDRVAVDLRHIAGSLAVDPGKQTPGHQRIAGHFTARDRRF